MSNPASKRALVVEDDASWRHILSEVLTDAGLTVETADSLEAALAMLKAASHRLAVIDLSLSSTDYANQDGIKVLDAVRRLDPDCKALLLSGYATVEIAVSALTEHGAFTCLRKETFNRAEFREWVQRALTSAPAIPASSDAAAAPEGRSHGQALLVEDDAGWRSILTELLTDAGYEVQACAGYGEALGRMRRHQFALAVIDLALNPSAMAGPTSLLRETETDGYRLLTSTHAAGTPTIVVSGIAGPEAIERTYAEQGVFAFVEKQTFDRRAFLRLVEEARAAARPPAALDGLSRREREVLELLAQGMTNKEIAEALVISTNTVKRHLKSIFEKLDVHTRAAAAARAINTRIPTDRERA